MAIASPYTSGSAVELIAPELTDLGTGVISSIIAEADARIEVDISPIIAANDLHALTAIPATISTLSLYLTRGYGYKKLYANRTDNPNGEDLHKYWMDQYNTLIAHILDKTIAITDASGSSTSNDTYTYNKSNTLKTLGTGNWGEYVEGID